LEANKQKQTPWQRKVLSYFVSFVLVIGLIYLSVKEVDLGSFGTFLISANYFWVLLSIPVMLASHWVRALRWKTMLKPIANPKSTWNLFSAVMAGYAVNNLIPRGGELIRPFYYSRREKISFTMTFATIVVERFIDLISLLLVFVFASFFFREQLKLALPNLHIEKIIYPTIALIIVAGLIFYKRWIFFVLEKILQPISNKVFEKLSDLFNKFFLGLTVIKQPSQYFQLAVESFLMWLLYTIPLYLMFFSFSFAYKFNLGFDDAVLLIIISGIGYTVAPTPGAIGFYHFLIQNALNKLYGISLEESLAYATVTHGINFLSQVVVGGIFIIRENLSIFPTINSGKTENNGEDSSESK